APDEEEHLPLLAHLDVVAAVSWGRDVGRVELAPEAQVDTTRPGQAVQLLERDDGVRGVAAVVAVHPREREVELVEPLLEPEHAGAPAAGTEGRHEDRLLQLPPVRGVALRWSDFHEDAIGRRAAGPEANAEPPRTGSLDEQMPVAPDPERERARGGRPLAHGQRERSPDLPGAEEGGVEARPDREGDRLGDGPAVADGVLGVGCSDAPV